MNNDISVCNACIGRIGNEFQYCPLREDCLRHSLFLLHRDRKRLGRIWQLVAPYDNGKCELKIKINDEQRNDEQRND